MMEELGRSRSNSGASIGPEEQDSAPNTPRGPAAQKPAAPAITFDEQALKSQHTATIKFYSPTEGDPNALSAQHFKTDYVVTDAKREVSGVEVAKQAGYGALSIAAFIGGFLTGGATWLLLPLTAGGMYKIQSKAHEAFVNQHWGQYDQPTLKAFVSAAAQGIQLSDKIKGPDGEEIEKTVKQAMIEFYGHLSDHEMTSRLRTLSTDFSAGDTQKQIEVLGLLEAIGKPIDLNKCTEGYGAATPVGQHDSDTTTRVNKPKPSVQKVSIPDGLKEPHAKVTSASKDYRRAWSKLLPDEKTRLEKEPEADSPESQNLTQAREKLATLKKNLTELNSARNTMLSNIESEENPSKEDMQTLAGLEESVVTQMRILKINSLNGETPEAKTLSESLVKIREAIIKAQQNERKNSVISEGKKTTSSENMGLGDNVFEGGTDPEVLSQNIEATRVQEQESAATKIRAAGRGHQARTEVANLKIEAKAKQEAERLAAEAALKIQQEADAKAKTEAAALYKTTNQSNTTAVSDFEKKGFATINEIEKAGAELQDILANQKQLITTHLKQEDQKKATEEITALMARVEDAASKKTALIVKAEADTKAKAEAKAKALDDTMKANKIIFEADIATSKASATEYQIKKHYESMKTISEAVTKFEKPDTQDPEAIRKVAGELQAKLKTQLERSVPVLAKDKQKQAKIEITALMARVDNIKAKVYAKTYDKIGYNLTEEFNTKKQLFEGGSLKSTAAKQLEIALNNLSLHNKKAFNDFKMDSNQKEALKFCLNSEFEAIRDLNISALEYFKSFNKEKPTLEVENMRKRTVEIKAQLRQLNS